MKTISFSCIEKLNKLLAKECSQTIRPAFCKDCGTESHWVNKKDGKGTRQMHLSRFKHGEKVKLYWKMRSKTQLFCKFCGDDFPNKCKCNVEIKNSDLFFKLLGTGTITSIEEIVMGKGNWGYYIGTDLTAPPKTISEEDAIRVYEEIAEADGFNSAEDFFHYFDSHYDLSQPKRFFVVRWVWD